jgi:hypothetical protein
MLQPSLKLNGFPTFHQFNESCEMVRRVVRSRGSFRMILNRNYRQRFVAHTFNATVVKIHVRHFHLRRQTVGVYREAMIV